MSENSLELASPLCADSTAWVLLPPTGRDVPTTWPTDFSSVSIGIFPIGAFISAIINFLIIALVVFWMVRLINRASDKLHKKKEAEPEAPADPEPSNEEKLLTEIRDLLKEQNK